ncbi:MAG: DUF58 domain-containing protein [Elainellaceae cyanobacterium]
MPIYGSDRLHRIELPQDLQASLTIKLDDNDKLIENDYRYCAQNCAQTLNTDELSTSELSISELNMQIHHHLSDWLESRWVIPAFSGWVLAGLAIFFFGAATNTMAGWLYVISGIMVALLAIAALLPRRSLRGIRVTRRSIRPVSNGQSVVVELAIANLDNAPKFLLQISDVLPFPLGKPVTQSVEVIPPRETYQWRYEQPTHHRGIYRWHTVHLRTAAPLGLFWCRQSHHADAKAVVYPTVLQLVRCPLIDELGRDTSTQIHHHTYSHQASKELTRALRPYRWGDSIRLIHWRTSARYGELRVREMEGLSGGQEVIIGLDNQHDWDANDFESAVVATASLYFYACHQSLQVSIWTAHTGQLRGDSAVLETLAAIRCDEAEASDRLPRQPLIWLTQNPASIQQLSLGSRWLLWAPHNLRSPTGAQDGASSSLPGFIIQPSQSLESQLQTSLTNSRVNPQRDRTPTK